MQLKMSNQDSKSENLDRHVLENGKYINKEYHRSNLFLQQLVQGIILKSNFYISIKKNNDKISLLTRTYNRLTLSTYDFTSDLVIFNRFCGVKSKLNK